MTGLALKAPIMHCKPVHQQHIDLPDDCLANSFSLSDRWSGLYKMWRCLSNSAECQWWSWSMAAHHLLCGFIVCWFDCLCTI